MTIRARYQRIFRDAAALAPALAPAVAAARVPVPALPPGNGACAVSPFPAYLPTLLPALLARQVSAPPGTDPFLPFAGRWAGLWHQDGGSTRYEHEWAVPDLDAGPPALLLQRVRIRGDDGVTVPALNACCGGVLTGAVGVREGRAQRPHAGFYPGPGTLLWLAREDEGGREARYSFFHEEVRGDRYVVLGLELRWDGAQLVAGATKGGCYLRATA